MRGQINRWWFSAVAKSNSESLEMFHCKIENISLFGYGDAKRHVRVQSIGGGGEENAIPSPLMCCAWTLLAHCYCLLFPFRVFCFFFFFFMWWWLWCAKRHLCSRALCIYLNLKDDNEGNSEIEFSSKIQYQSDASWCAWKILNRKFAENANQEYTHSGGMRSGWQTI